MKLLKAFFLLNFLTVNLAAMNLQVIDMDRSEDPVEEKADLIQLLGASHEGKCAACPDALNTQLLHRIPQAPIDDYAFVLPCLHAYHLGCLSNWSQRQNTCPECREKFELHVLAASSVSAFKESLEASKNQLLASEKECTNLQKEIEEHKKREKGFEKTYNDLFELHAAQTREVARLQARAQRPAIRVGPPPRPVGLRHHAAAVQPQQQVPNPASEEQALPAQQQQYAAHVNRTNNQNWRNHPYNNSQPQRQSRWDRR